MDVSMPIDH
jgi:hypothetical protein